MLDLPTLTWDYESEHDELEFDAVCGEQKIIDEINLALSYEE